MVLSIIRTIWSRLRPTPRLRCDERLWREILRELRVRGQGRRESGGFLLGRVEGETKIITSFLPYDAVDPHCLQGIIIFDGSRMDDVWRICEQQGCSVVADVHTHPGASYRQSDVDQSHPMIPERGHLALIVPNYANRDYMPGEFGIHEYRGRRDGWSDLSSLGRKLFRVRRFA
ncbi:Mov34/MPN/PAD-1 family protein [Bradyrhizobium manausense]